MNNTTKIILAIIMTAITITIGFLFSRNSTDQISQTAKQTTYDKIIKTGKIRIGYTSNPPAFIIDPNSGKFSGVFPEVMEEIAKKLQLELEYKEDVGWESMIEAVKSKNPVAATFLRAIEPIAGSEGRVDLRARYSLHRNFFSTPRNKEMVEEALEVLLGVKTEAVFILDEASPSSGQSNSGNGKSREEQFYETVKEVFG